jgi:protein-tyrosine phosphatase
LPPSWVRTECCRLGIMPRPRGGDWLEEDIRLLKDEGVEVLVSALEPDECAELELSREAAACRRSGIEFVSFPIADRSVPASLEEFREFLAAVGSHLRSNKAVVVHCRAGIGRSSLIAASLLQGYGLSVATAFELLRQARGIPVPDTPEQREWVEGFAARTKNAGER